MGHKETSERIAREGIGVECAPDHADAADRLGDYVGHAGRRGRDGRLRLSGRRDSAGLRRAAQVSHPARAGAPRAGRGAHGRRLRARFGQGGRGHCHQRSGRDESRDRHRHGDAGFDSHRLHHRQRVEQVLGTDAFQEVDITGITLPVTKHNFLVSKAEDMARGAAPCVSDCAIGAARARCWWTLPRMRSRRTAVFDFEAAKPRAVSPASHAARGGIGTGAGRRADSQREAAGDSGRPRRDGVRRDGAGAHAGRARADSCGAHAAGAGRISRFASAEPGHDGHARRGVGESRHSGSRSADRLRHALRRSRDGQADGLRARRPRRFTSRSIRRRSTRT